MHEYWGPWLACGCSGMRFRCIKDACDTEFEKYWFLIVGFAASKINLRNKQWKNHFAEIFSKLNGAVRDVEVRERELRQDEYRENCL